MKVLILSCHTGEGHNAAARALKAQFDNLEIPCDIIDALCFGFKGKSALLSHGHTFVYKHLPRAFGATYAMLEMPKRHRTLPLLYRQGRRAAKRLCRFACENGYDAVLCTHTFGAALMTEAKRYTQKNIPFYLVATDYTCYPALSKIKADAFFIAHKDLLWAFEAEGIPKEKLIPSGIPVAYAFESSLSKEEAAKALKLSLRTKKILLMGGSIGCGHMEKIASLCANALKEGEELLVVCGKNERLRKALEKRRLPHTTAIGFTKQISLYMDASDLFVTKAGGLSTTEAAKKGLPMLFFDAVPGVETHNLRFFCQKGYAKSALLEEQLSHTLRELLESPTALASMRQKMKEDFGENATKIICKHTIQKYNEATLIGDETYEN